jgi:hypothetical protein
MEDRHLTLGCEFECVLVQPKLEGKVTDSGENVLKNIFSEKFTLQCADCPDTFQWKPKLFDRATRKSPKNNADEALFWHVDRDRTDALPDEEKSALGKDMFGFKIEGLEIKSRKFVYEPSAQASSLACESKGHRASYDEEIRAVLNRLNERLCHFRVEDILKGYQKSFLFVNSKAGFHVHPGCIENQVPVPTLRRLCSMFLAWERQIDSLHSGSRISGSTLPTANTEPVAKHDLREFVMDRYVQNQPLSLYLIHTAYNRRYRRSHETNSA